MNRSILHSAIAALLLACAFVPHPASAGAPMVKTQAPALRIDKADTDFWLSEDAMNRAPAEARDFFKTAMWGDLMHVAAVQFENPGVTIRFGTDSLKIELPAPALAGRLASAG